MKFVSFFAPAFNHDHNNLRIFDVLASFPFTTSETMIKKHGIYQLFNELQNDVRLRILRNQEIPGKSQNLMELYPNVQNTQLYPNVQFLVPKRTFCPCW